MTFSRNNQIDKLKNNHEYDLLIIGGGIVGAAAHTIASNTGLNVLLVDKNDCEVSRTSVGSISGGTLAKEPIEFLRKRNITTPMKKAIKYSIKA